MRQIPITLNNSTWGFPSKILQRYVTTLTHMLTYLFQMYESRFLLIIDTKFVSKSSPNSSPYQTITNGIPICNEEIVWYGKFQRSRVEIRKWNFGIDLFLINKIRAIRLCVKTKKWGLAILISLKIVFTKKWWPAELLITKYTTDVKF